MNCHRLVAERNWRLRLLLAEKLGIEGVSSHFDEFRLCLLGAVQVIKGRESLWLLVLWLIFGEHNWPPLLVVVKALFCVGDQRGVVALNF